MERYCFLHHALACPGCAAPFADAQGQVRFFWGLLGAEYHLGDQIRWGAEGCGLLPWLERTLGGADVHGAPGLARVCVFDVDDDYSFWRCGTCKVEFDRPVISIEDNVIASVRLLRRNEVIEEFGVDRGDNDALTFDSRARQWKVFENARLPPRP